MKIVKKEKYESLYDFLKDVVKEYPYLKYHEGSWDEFGCDIFLRENKWFGKNVCFFGGERVTIYLEEYKNDVIDIVRRWEKMSGQEYEVAVP